MRSQIDRFRLAPGRSSSMSLRVVETSSRVRNRWQTQLEEDSDGEPGDASSTGAAKQQKQQSSLPPVSPENLSPLEQKRALRLEMLTRMIGEITTETGS